MTRRPNRPEQESGKPGTAGPARKPAPRADDGGESDAKDGGDRVRDRAMRRPPQDRTLRPESDR